MDFRGIPEISISLSGPQRKMRRVKAALAQFGFGELDISLPDLSELGKVVQLGREPNRIDLLTSITGVSFIGKAALLRNKDSTGRDKDKIDAHQLRKLPPRT